MSRLGLLLLWMHDGGRLLLDITVYKESDAEKNKRDTEPLSHIQDHVLLETDLRFLDEFYQKTHAEATDEECSYEEASVELRQSILIHQNLEYSQKKIT